MGVGEHMQHNIMRAKGIPQRTNNGREHVEYATCLCSRLCTRPSYVWLLLNVAAYKVKYIQVWQTVDDRLL